ncbi:MAG: phosphatidylglycerophosphatase A family protein [bacterium]
MKKRIYLSLVTVFGIGYLPWMPGTWTSLAAIFIWWFLISKPLIFLAALLVLFFLSVHVCTEVEKISGQKDPHWVTVDELLGMGVALLLLPSPDPAMKPYFAVMAFILFRLFDIWKPYPIRRIENLPGGWGIMADDLVAGIYACFFLQVGAFVVRIIA